MKPEAPQVSRRRFVQGLAAGGVLAAMPNWLYARSLQTAAHGLAPEIRSNQIDLVVEETLVNFTGTVSSATAINGSIPAPTLRLREGEEVVIRVTNRLNVPTSIHWHGILLPYQMDGVPGLSFNGIAPGETFTYRFTPRQHGTYWYHSHSGMQELTGMYGALIIDPAHAHHHDMQAHGDMPGQMMAMTEAQRDYVIQLSDWSDDHPMAVLGRLKSHSDLYNFNQPTVGDFVRDASATSLSAAWHKRAMWNEMRMSPTDLADTSAAVMTYLMNGTTPAGNWTGLFKRGDTVKLRFINAAGNTFYDVRIPGQTLTVIAADGQPLQPVKVHEFRFGPGETYDVLVTPTQDACTLFAQTMDRSGYACGTLAVAAGMSAPVPATDPVEWLSMGDMMGSMDHSSRNHEAMDHEAMNHESMGHDMSAMDHSMMGHDMGAMDHSSMNHSSMNHAMPPNPLAKPSSKVSHASSEYGATVDMRVDTPRTNLDDPGVGLRELDKKERRGEGHKVLTLADQRSAHGVLSDTRVPVKEIELHLTGNMERYSWSLDGLEFGNSTPVAMKRGERIRVILHNDTMMTHPMHLHGMWSDLESGDGELLVRRHTLPVQPAQRISFLTTPEDLGRWAWHCHLMFHMDMGMFREVVVYE
ncbi:copper resistance system multicopper oxidase [Thalassolituus sp. LLYu03]|uniref:copper resistance system multicopper oxidase n=1 Tax=Thalassolituus sp. LLYu03 TaxID=3421656 RepID=UPI003D27AA6B